MVGADAHARDGLASALLGLPRVGPRRAGLRERRSRALDELGVGDVRRPAAAARCRTAIAEAGRRWPGRWSREPELLLLDEPAGGLAAAEIEELAELIRALRRRASVLLVEHHMDLVMSVCDRVVVLDFGRVIAAARRPRSQADPG